MFRVNDPNVEADHIQRYERFVLWLFIVLAMAFRLSHMSGPLDELHSWRQADTAYGAQVMASQTFPDPFHPRVNWLGEDGRYAMEFPLYQCTAAWIYKAVGVNLVFARALTLSFFLVSAMYFFAILQILLGHRWAWHATTAYMILPLGVFYSRAVHVDFAAIAFAHAFLYHAMVYLESRSRAHGIVAVTAATLSFLIKAPYCFYLVLPAVCFGLFRTRVRSFRVFVDVALLAAVPILLFLSWRYNCDVLNGQYVNPYPEAHIKKGGEWFFGEWSMRLHPGKWLTIAERLFHEVFTSFGTFLAALGILLIPRVKTEKALFVLSWWVGLGVYTFIFFNLNYIHNYYQLPYLAAAAIVTVLFGLGLSSGLSGGRRAATVAIIFAFLSFYSWHAQGGYYSIDELRMAAGRMLHGKTEDQDLLVITSMGPDIETDDPRVLYYAGRQGWSIRRQYLTAAVIDTYVRQGAGYVACVVSEDSLEAFTTPAALRGVSQGHAVLAGSQGTRLGMLYMYDVRPSRESQELRPASSPG